MRILILGGLGVADPGRTKNSLPGPNVQDFPASRVISRAPRRALSGTTRLGTRELGNELATGGAGTGELGSVSRTLGSLGEKSGELENGRTGHWRNGRTGDRRFEFLN